MPWEPLGAYVMGKALDVAAAKMEPKVRVFAERLRSRWNRPIAERHLRLNGPELVTFYSSDSPFLVRIADEEFVLPARIETPATAGGGLTTQALRFRIVDRGFSLDPSLDDYRASIHEEAKRDKRLFDGRVVRMCELSPTGIATLCHASYFDALATNFAMDHAPPGRAETLRQAVHHASRSVGDLRTSKLVNHLGLVCMVESADGMLVAQQRASAVANRANTISSSVSGAVNLSDVRPFMDRETGLLELAHAVFREALEELGVEAHTIRFLGLLRELLRGGKPELYFYARTASSIRAIVTARASAEGRKETKAVQGFEFHSERVGTDDGSRFAFQERVRQVLKQTDRRANFTFVAGTLLSANHVLQSSAHTSREPR